MQKPDPIRSKIMSRIRAKATKEEVRLAKALWHRGHRYRKNNRKIKGTPDLTFQKHKLAIFVDGEFWHGKDWDPNQNRIKSNPEFWKQKIERNINRDKEVNTFLEENGWTVLRFWSAEVRKNLDAVIAKIENTIVSLRTKKYRSDEEDLRLAAEPKL